MQTILWYTGPIAIHGIRLRFRMKREGINGRSLFSLQSRERALLWRERLKWWIVAMKAACHELLHNSLHSQSYSHMRLPSSKRSSILWTLCVLLVPATYFSYSDNSPHRAGPITHTGLNERKPWIHYKRFHQMIPGYWHCATKCHHLPDVQSFVHESLTQIECTASILRLVTSDTIRLCRAVDGKVCKLPKKASARPSLYDPPPNDLILAISTSPRSSYHALISKASQHSHCTVRCQQPDSIARNHGQLIMPWTAKQVFCTDIIVLLYASTSRWSCHALKVQANPSARFPICQLCLPTMIRQCYATNRLRSKHLDLVASEAKTLSQTICSIDQGELVPPTPVSKGKIPPGCICSLSRWRCLENTPARPSLYDPPSSSHAVKSQSAFWHHCSIYASTSRWSYALKVQKQLSARFPISFVSTMIRQCYVNRLRIETLGPGGVRSQNIEPDDLQIHRSRRTCYAPPTPFRKRQDTTSGCIQCNLPRITMHYFERFPSTCFSQVRTKISIETSFAGRRWFQSTLLCRSYIDELVSSIQVTSSAIRDGAVCWETPVVSQESVSIVHTW
jgi:hypothetical protein